jgi:hypothetical protein
VPGWPLTGRGERGGASPLKGGDGGRGGDGERIAICRCIPS